MSPSEFDLRAALRDGEGDGTPDVDAVIARAGGIARRRRQVFLTASVAAVVVALGGGTFALHDNGSKGSPSADQRGAEKAPSAGTGYVAGNGAAAGAGAPVPSATGSGTDPALVPHAGTLSLALCPSAPKQYVLPGGGGTGQFGGSGPLFAKPVETLVFCGYTDSKVVSANQVDGSDAREVAASMEAASTKFVALGCPAAPPDQPVRAVDIRATATDGTQLPDVIVRQRYCENQLTNGTAVRYNWAEPSWVGNLAEPANVPSKTPSPGMMSGSPAR